MLTLASSSLPTTQAETPALDPPAMHLVAFARQGVFAMPLLAARPIVVGRAPECDVRLETPLLSRAHFTVRIGATLVVEDLGSSNGTKVNGARIPPRTPVSIECGALLEAGGHFFLVRDHAPPDSLLVAPANAAARAIALTSRAAPHGAVVADAAMVRLYELVERIAQSEIPVLVVGETGAGKEVIANAVHQGSTRASGPFVTLNCAALPEALLESELFGFEKGAFTGAVQSKPGLVECADRGTLFLDEIGEMPLATQAKLLRVLENGELLRVGALKPRTVDVRFVAATNQNVTDLVARGAFRRDLYFRLNGITVPVPPLRERRADIAPLANMFLAQAAKRSGRRAPELSPEVLALLASHAWPGNVRELRNVIERALALSTEPIVRSAHVLLDDASIDSGASAGLPRATPMPSNVDGQGDTLRAGVAVRGLMRLDPAVERRLILEALTRAGGHQRRAAELLGISRRTLINRLDEYGLERPRKRMSDG